MLNMDTVVNQDSQALACAKGHAAFKKQSYKEALSFYNEALESGANKDAYFGLGQVYKEQGNLINAVKRLSDALKIDPAFHEAFCLLGDIYYEQGQGTPAIESYGQAVAISPGTDKYKQKLVNVVGSLTFKKVNLNLKGVLLECLESNSVEFVHFGRAWLSIISSDPLIAQIYKFSKHNSYAAFKKSMDSLPNYDGLIEPFFLTGLGKFIVPELEFERWCTYLRRFLLEAISSDQQLFSDPEDIELMACALSKYCFFTDYIFDVSESEKLLVEALQKKVSAKDRPCLAELGALGCYYRLCLLENSQAIAGNLQGGDHVSQIPKSQIEDYFSQQEVKEGISALTKIEDQVSSAVQEQYEEFPYPRWEVTAKDLFNEEIEGYLQGRKAKILNAGCGTGKEAIQTAYVLPDSQITAVDLSRTSLAYAAHKARQLEIDNIKFAQADIMELGQIDHQFDFITSAGVLHHMKDPKAGWKVLEGLLKPGGLMRISLYSRQARWAINEARQVIKEKNIGSDAMSIRNFRKNVTDHLKYKSIKNISNFYDYYGLPECRDLLFHVQEHQFDLLEIKKILDELGLEFLQLFLPGSDLRKYKKRNADDPNVSDLESLARWESKNPDLFVAMYTFWCRKKST